MSCTTILVGKRASYDGSTMIARNDDSGADHFTPKKMVIVDPAVQPKVYESTISHVRIELPEKAMRYSAMPNAVEGKGIWAACGVNEANVGMTATETITTNERVLGADPLVIYKPGKAEKDAKVPKNCFDIIGCGEKALKSAGETAAETATATTAAESHADDEAQVGGIGEEDLVVLVLPYIHSAREGVECLGSLLEKYGTYETNGIAFSDKDEIWWLETIGGHHWMAKRVPDDCYVVMPNQLGIDSFDFEDAYGAKKEHMCSPDLREFTEKFHLDLSLDGKINPRQAYGSHDDADHVYNTPRAWFMLRYLNPRTKKWEGPDADYTPESDDLPWCMVPERKVTPEDVKYVLSSHFQGTDFDPYRSYGDPGRRGMYRSIGINRNDFMGFVQIRAEGKEQTRAIEWIAYASNAFNAMVPLYTNVSKIPAYFSTTTGEVSTESFYWVSRLVAALSDAYFKGCQAHIERYQLKVQAIGHGIINRCDALFAENADLSPEETQRLMEKANEEIAHAVKDAASTLLDQVLFEASSHMKNAFARSDA